MFFFAIAPVIILVGLPSARWFIFVVGYRWVRIARGWHEHWALPPRDRVIGEMFRGSVTAEPVAPRMPTSVRCGALAMLLASPLAGLVFAGQLLQVREWAAYIAPSGYDMGVVFLPRYRCSSVAFAPDLVAFRFLKGSLVACGFAVVLAFAAGWLLPQRTARSWSHLRRAIVAIEISVATALASLAVATVRQGIDWMWWVPVCRTSDMRVVSHAGLSLPAITALLGIVGAFTTSIWLRRVMKRYPISA